MRGWFSALTAPTARAPYGRSNPAVNPSVPLGRVAANSTYDLSFGTSTLTTNLNSATYKAGRRYRAIISWQLGGSTGTTTGQHTVNLPGGASIIEANQNVFKFDVGGVGNTSGVYVFEFTVASDITATMSVGSRLVGGAGTITINGFSITVDDIGQ